MQVTSSLHAYTTPNGANWPQQDADASESQDFAQAAPAHDSGSAPQARNTLADMARDPAPASKPSDSDPQVDSACKPVHNGQEVSPAVGYTLGQSGNAISAAGATAQSFKNPPAPTGFLGSISRIFGSIFGFGVGLLDPEVAKGTANMHFHVEARKCFEEGKCDEMQWLQLKEMYNNCPKDAWEELNRLKSQ